MANYTDSFIDVLRYKISQAMEMPEFKEKPSNILAAFLENTNFLVPGSELERATNQKDTDRQTAYINLINRQAISTGSNRAYNHSGSRNASTKTALSYITKTADFQYTVKENDGNIYTKAETLSKQFLSAILAIHRDFETYVATWLNTNKSQVVNSLTPSGGTWDAANYIFQVVNSDEARFYQRVKGFMRQQYYKGQMYFFGDEYSVQQGEYLANQGNGNATNLGWQLNDTNIISSQDITPGSGYAGQGFMLPSGTFGALNWIPQLNRTGFGNTFGNGGAYYSIPDPFGLPITYAVHELAVGADNQSAGSERQDVNINVEVSTDFAFVKAPMTTANAAPIFKVGLLDEEVA